MITHFLTSKCNVTVLDILLPSVADRHPSVAYCRGNILSLSDLSSAFSAAASSPAGPVHSVVHAASIIPFVGVSDSDVRAVNVGGTANLLSASMDAGVRSFVYTSSMSVVLEKGVLFGPSCLNMKEETSPYPKIFEDIYPETKAAAERLVLKQNDPSAMATCVLRPTAIFGPGDRQVSDHYLKGPELPQVVLGDGAAKIDWVPADCVASAHVLAERGLSELSVGGRRAAVGGNVYFIGNGEANTYAWFNGVPDDPAVKVNHWGHPPPRVLGPGVSALVMGICHLNVVAHFLTGVVPLPPAMLPSLLLYCQRDYTCSYAKAERDFGYKPLFTVREAIVIYKKRYIEKMEKKVK